MNAFAGRLRDTAGMPGQRRRRFFATRQVPCFFTRQVARHANRRGASPLPRRITCGVTRTALSTLACLLALAAGAAGAQTPLHVRGTLVEFALWSAQAPLMLRATTRDGSAIAIEVADNWEAYPIAPIDRDKLVDGSYVGVVAVAAGDGTLRARAVLLYPEYLRGTLLGHHPWDSAPGSTMTNATISTIGDATVDAVQGRMLVLKLKDGEKKVFVPATAPIVAYEPADRSAITPGASIILFARKNDDGALTAASVNVGKNGLQVPY